MKKILLVILSLFFVIPVFAEITEEKVVDKVEILANGIIQVREATIIKKDGIEIAKTYSRHIVDVEDSTENEVKKVKDIASVVWTPEVKAARKAEKEKNKVK